MKDILYCDDNEYSNGFLVESDGEKDEMEYSNDDDGENDDNDYSDFIFVYNDIFVNGGSSKNDSIVNNNKHTVKCFYVSPEIFLLTFRANHSTLIATALMQSGAVFNTDLYTDFPLNKSGEAEFFQFLKNDKA